MWPFLIRRILRNRLQFLIVIFVITAIMSFLARDVKLSYEMARILPASDSTYIIYQQFKEKFGEDGSVLFIGIQDTNLFQINEFNDWFDLSETIRRVPGVEEVVSITRLYNLQKNDSLKKFEFVPLIRHKPETQHQVDSLKKLIFSLPFYEKLIINRETGVTIIAVTLDNRLLNTKQRINLITEIRDVTNQFGSRYNIDIHYSGLPYIRTVTSKMLEDEMKLFVFLSLLIAAIFLYIFFRSFKAVLYPILIVIISVVWALGMMSLFGYKITMLTAIIPPLLIVIGVENCIFLLNKYHYEYRLHQNKVKALSRVIQRVGSANFLTNVSTAIGFAAFTITKNTLLVEFGVIAAINIMVVYALSLTLVPIFYSYLPPPRMKDVRHQEESIARAIIDKAVIWVTGYRNIIYYITGAMVLVGVVGVTQLHTSGRIVDDIPQENQLYQDLMFFEENFNGIMPLEITIDTKKKKGVFTLSTLNRINRLQDSLKTYPELARPLSIVEVIKSAKQTFYGGDPKFYQLPNSNELTFMGSYIPEMKSKKQTLIKNFIDTNFQTTRISVQMANIGTNEIARLQKSVRATVDTIFNPEKYDVTITGTSIVFMKGTNFLIRNLFESIIIALIGIAILLAFLFSSWRMILISLIPNLIPQLMTGALMGFLGIPIKPSTILIFSIALGISVDNSIQFLSRYRLQLKHSNRNIPYSVISALQETGYSMIYSSTVLFFGFGIFVLSKFGGTQAMGFLISFTLLVAGLLNLFILPSLILTLDKWSTTKAFEKPLVEIFEEPEEEEIIDIELPPEEGPPSK
ncbi:MAG: MMPL family transporter [Bacteroidales bacterium]|nr:MMPL family transporter [Bacteroidales bacterium]